MIKKFLLLLLIYSSTLSALERGDTLPQSVQERLHLKANQVYVIDFFASWCKSCKKELPLISKVHLSKVTQVIGINVDAKRTDGEAFVQALKLPFPIVYDTDKQLVKLFDPFGFPALYYVKNGKILRVIMGAVDAIDTQITQDMKHL